jgi:hypothetical protein
MSTVTINRAGTITDVLPSLSLPTLSGSQEFTSDGMSAHPSSGAVIHGAVVNATATRSEHHSAFARLKRSEFAITETELSAIAPAAITGDRSRPNAG